MECILIMLASADRCRFLLAEFQLKHVLAKKVPRSMKEALMSLPASLENAYKDIVIRITEKGKDAIQLAWRILSWVFYAFRPLSMDELREAIAVEPEDIELEQNLMDPDDIVEICESLLVHDESSETVRFAHYSVNEFLTNCCMQDLLSCVHLANTCLTYLAFKTFDEPYLDKRRVQRYKFSRYAAQFWALHTKGEAENEPDIQRAVLSLLASENKKDSMLQLETYANSSWGNISFTKGQTLLHVIAKNGLATICKRVLSRRINGNDTYVLEVDI